MKISLLCLRNIIDVSAADSVVMEQHEYMDKAKQYRYVFEDYLFVTNWTFGMCKPII